MRAIQAAALTEPWPALLDPDAPLDPRLWVIEDDRVCGYAAALTVAGPAAYLPEIAVEPARQREGLGSRLLEAVAADLAADGFERLRLTAPDDDRLRRFYERHGFAVLDRDPGRFASGAGLVMERRLGGPGDGQD